VLAAQADFQLLLAVLVLGRPFRIVFPSLVLAGVSFSVIDIAYFMISLDLIIRLISSTTNELTHTIGPHVSHWASRVPLRCPGGRGCRTLFPD